MVSIRGVAIIALALLPLLGQCALMARGYLFVDFSAFYCAGQAVAHKESPYTVEPLRQCEQSTAPVRAGRDPRLVLPAPLPGYSILAFVPLALLPFSVAAGIWFVVLLAACIVCVVAIGRITKTPWDVVAAALSLSLAAFAIPFGQIVPLVMAAICLCAYFAQQGRWRAAGIAAIASMVEPHLGIGVCAALAVWARPARQTLALGFVILALLSLVALSTANNLDYISQVLPAHAISEATFKDQYSVTAVLTALGVTDREAVRIGSIWYLIAVTVGTVVGGVLFRKGKNAAFLALVPPAFSVFGGVFVHLTQIAVSLAPALLLLRYETTSRRTAALGALLLLAFPWPMAASPMGWLAPVFPIGYLTWFYSGKSLKAAIYAGALAAVLMLTIAHSAIVDVGAKHQLYLGTAIDDHLSEAPWSFYLRSNFMPTIASWLTRTPTWIGLVLLLWLLMVNAMQSYGLRRLLSSSIRSH